ncbi:MAG: hypothetical protein ACI4VL_04770 [Bacilli bacterium]
MINFLIDWQDVGNGALAALRILLLKICEPIYSLIVFCFDIFEDFGKVRLFAESDTISLIYTRVGLILGLFMIFRLTFAAIEYLINPDKMMDSKSGIGNIIKKVLIVVILLGSTRFLFDFAFNLQDKLIASNIVGNLILGPSYDESEKNSSGVNLAWYSFRQFYRINDYFLTETDAEGNKTTLEGTNANICEGMLKNDSNKRGSIYLEFEDKHTLNNAEYCLNMSEKGTLYQDDKEKEINIIDFNGFLCLAVGLVLLWIIITYTVQVGVRVFQLAYLELIAPIPIMMYLMPNGDEKLKKWGQQCLTTFLDFFIRLAIMDFIILVSNALIELTYESNILKNFGELSTWGVGYITIILIIALFIFAKKVPELLKEIFPSSGGAAGLSFGIGKGLPTFGIGAVAGSVAGMASGIRNGYGVKGKIAGAFGGFNRGLVSGAKTKGNIIKNVQGGMSSTRQARQRALDRQIYKIDQAKITKEYQDNEAIIAAKKAIDDRAESQLLKTDAGAQEEQARLNYIESNVGKYDATLGRSITIADVVAQKAAYKTYMDGAKATWVNANSRTDAEIAKQMQAIQNKTGTSINNYSDADTAASTAKTNNARAARTVTENEAEKQKIQAKKSKIK